MRDAEKDESGDGGQRPVPVPRAARKQSTPTEREPSRADEDQAGAPARTGQPDAAGSRGEGEADIMDVGTEEEDIWVPDEDPGPPDPYAGP